MKRILSIDPARDKKWAFAYFRDSRLCYFDRVEELEKIPDQDIDYVVTENPYPGGKIRKYSYKGWAESYGNLRLAAGMVIQFSKSINAQYKLIRPVDWKTFYSLTKTTPVAIQDTIRVQLTGIQRDEDLQDAVLIGRYFLEHVMRKAVEETIAEGNISDLKLYRYIARGSIHRGHIIRIILFKKGKVLADCQDCGKTFYGLRRFIRKLKEGKDCA